MPVCLLFPLPNLQGINKCINTIVDINFDVAGSFIFEMLIVDGPRQESNLVCLGVRWM